MPFLFEETCESEMCYLVSDKVKEGKSQSCWCWCCRSLC